MNAMTHSRAPKGGAFGANGEWYEGGKFINTVAANSKRAASSRKATRKQEIEPYVWAVPEVEGQISLLRQFAGVFGGVKNGVAFVLPELKQVTLDYYGKTIEEIQSMIDRYNAGQRWV